MNTPLLALRSTPTLSASRCLFRNTSAPSQNCQFSSSAQRWPRGKRGTNKMRGMSAIRSTGKLKDKITSITPETLPVPMMDPARRQQIEYDSDHGLWAFFNREKQSITPPGDIGNHGRAWTKHELRLKSWEDMHALWWKCHLELNRIATELAHRVVIKPGYGDYELEERQKVVRHTMKAIRITLVERWDAWNDAQQILKEGADEEIELVDGQLHWREGAERAEPWTAETPAEGEKTKEGQTAERR